MPTYGYRCGSCGHEFEIVQKISDEPLKVCPKCQGKLSKMLYPTGVIFKGSGYYTTDYKASSSSQAESGNGSTSNKGGESTSEKKTSEPTSSTKSSESKTDSKTEKAS